MKRCRCVCECVSGVLVCVSEHTTNQLPAPVDGSTTVRERVSPLRTVAPLAVARGAEPPVMSPRSAAVLRTPAPRLLLVLSPPVGTR